MLSCAFGCARRKRLSVDGTDERQRISELHLLLAKIEDRGVRDAIQTLWDRTLDATRIIDRNVTAVANDAESLRQKLLQLEQRLAQMERR
jgi:hypothetical protein